MTETEPLDRPFRLRMSIQSPEKLNSRGYTERSELASFDIPIDEAKAWRIYQQAVASSLEPDFIVTFPTALAVEDAERFRSEWTRKHKK